MTTLQKFIKNKPYLVWSTTQYDKLSDKVIAESILNYGTWEEYLFLENTLGLQKLNEIFNDLKNSKRTNLRPQVVNYFSNYFNIYA